MVSLHKLNYAIIFPAITLLMVLIPMAKADDFSNVLSASLGMVSVSLAENSSSLQKDSTTTTTTTEAEDTSSSISTLSLDINYEFKNYAQRSYFVKLVLPTVAAAGSGYFVGALGINYYISGLSAPFLFLREGTSLTMLPKLRYFWGAHLGIGYLVYSTNLSKKSDLNFEIGLHAGASYNFSNSWGMKGEASVGKGTGVATSSMVMRFFVGATYFLDNS
jgi:hypothetical protein